MFLDAKITPVQKFIKAFSGLEIVGYQIVKLRSILFVKDWAEFNSNSIKRTSDNYWITQVNKVLVIILCSY